MKRFSIVLTICSLVVALVSVAAAPRASGNVSLISVVFVPGKGPVFTFHVDGKFSRADLKGSVHVNGGSDYDIHCVQVDNETVKCTAPKAAGGTDATISWGGSTFWTFVPEAPEFCYGVWDFWTVEDYLNGWKNYGPHCQETSAKELDQITYTVPELGFDAPAWFLNDPDECDIPNHGSAYYWAPWCASEPE